MIKIYDDNRNLLISTNEYSNFSVLKEINQPDQFSIDTTEEIGNFIRLEGYIETKEGTFVIKEKSFANYYRIMGSQDLEDLDDFIEHKRFERSTLKEMIQGLVAPYGWTVVGDSPDKKTINIDNKAVIDGVFDCINLFKYEIKFDNINKVIHIAKELGNDRGTYFHSDLNLKKITISSDSYDFATRIIPVGNEGLTIESVNNGKKYLENHKYSNKVKTIYWRDNRYHIPENLKATAEEMLENLAKPLSSLNCEIVNLVNNSKYSFLDFDVGDKVIIVDNNLKIKEKHRITSYLKYPNEPHRGVVTFENKPRDVIDRFTDIDYRFDNYDNKFDDYDFKFDDFDMIFDDFNLEFDQINNDLSDRLSVIEEMLGIGLSCIVIKNEDIVKNKDLEDPSLVLPEEMNVFVYKNEYGECITIPEDIEEINIRVERREGVNLNDNNLLKVRNDGPINGYYMFADSHYLDISKLNTEFMTNAESMFRDYSGSMVSDDVNKIVGVESMNTSNVTNMRSMFYNMFRVTHLDLSSFDTSNVTNMEYMFMFCSSLVELDISSFDTSNVTNMYGMFSGCSSLVNLDLSSFDTSNVTDMAAMFRGCSSLINLDISHFNITTKYYDSMFDGCTSLQTLNMPILSGNSVSLYRTFRDTPNLTGAIDLSGITSFSLVIATEAFVNCGADVIYVNENLSQIDIDKLEDPNNNPNGIPVVIK